ncbi:MAG: nitroreductase family protein [Lachnospiraceae bacterium]|nr:nitroreductase family protein [Lachnospiraceae bacterium]MCM1230803.1 nitroreductase family protein [Ruminococcus flavefaciens]
MELIQGIQERRSVRKFKSEPIPRETMREIVRLTSYAPSWKNTQTVRYTVVENRAILDEIAENGVMGFTYNSKTIHRCSVLVAQSVVMGICGYEKDGSFSTAKKDSWEMYDAGISAQTFCLAAHSKGIGSVIMGIYDENIIAELIRLPKGERVTALIALGYPETDISQIPPRKDVDELLRYRTK